MKQKETCFEYRKFSEKEIALYEAVNALLRRGEVISDLRVADIAQQAGIGKGTVYEYVSSKEELIAKAFLYHLGQELEQLRAGLASEKGFKEQCQAVFGCIYRDFSSGMNMLQLFLASNLSQQLLQTMERHRDSFDAAVDELFALLDQMLDQGVKEGVLEAGHPSQYRQFVLTSICSGLLSRLCGRRSTECEQEMAYQMLVNALGKHKEQ
ncbi:transcriptional repressor BetI [uncultured Ruminococcus sp.]|nr:transcriptional repressor BetI [uncultured Ruminococcus sp.]SCH31225.1 transcriptional repressor BetI [uncultured Clostridium sp.]